MKLDPQRERRQAQRNAGLSKIFGSAFQEAEDAVCVADPANRTRPRSLRGEHLIEDRHRSCFCSNAERRKACELHAQAASLAAVKSVRRR